MDTIVVVGAGLAGVRAAQALRAEGFGGALTIVGDEHHPPYSRPPLSKEVLTGAAAPESTVLPTGDLAATWLLGTEAVGLDRKAREVRLGDGTGLTYDGLVVATGARARDLPGRSDLRGFHTLRTWEDATAFRSAALAARHVVVAGGGVLGCEAAASLRSLGVPVTLIDQAPRLMAPLGEEVSAWARTAHEDAGVTVELGVGIAGFRGVDEVRAVELADGRAIEADAVLVAVGARPDVAWLEGSGLQVDAARGIATDEFCLAVGDPTVMACGDVAEFDAGPRGRRRLEHWSNAVDMAGVGARNLLVPASERSAYRPIPTMWSDQYGLRFQAVGDLGLVTRTTVVEVDQERKRLVVEGVDEGGRLVAALGINAARSLLRYHSDLAPVLEPSSS